MITANDYTALDNKLTFVPSAESEQTICHMVAIHDDREVEGPELFRIQLTSDDSRILLQPSVAAVTITDSDGKFDTTLEIVIKLMRTKSCNNIIIIFFILFLPFSQLFVTRKSCSPLVECTVGHRRTRVRRPNSAAHWAELSPGSALRLDTGKNRMCQNA